MSNPINAQAKQRFNLINIQEEVIKMIYENLTNKKYDELLDLCYSSPKESIHKVVTVEHYSSFCNGRRFSAI